MVSPVCSAPSARAAADAFAILTVVRRAGGRRVVGLDVRRSAALDF